MAAIDFPNNPADGEQYKASNGVSYIYDIIDNSWTTVAEEGSGGSARVSVGPNPPIGPAEGDLWFNSNVGILYVWYIDVDQTADGAGQWVDCRPGNDGGSSS